MGIARLAALVALLILGLVEGTFGADKGPIGAADAGAQAGSIGHSGVPLGAPEIFEPKLDDGRAVIQLPGEANELAAGGGGRYLVAHLKALHALAVVDLCNANVAHVFELPAGENHFAVGLSKIFVASNEKNSITRYDLETFDKELTAFAPDGGVQAMAMGSASVSPLVVASGKHTLLYDPQTLHGQTMTWKNYDKPGSNWPAPTLRVSGDGQTVIAWGSGWAGIELAAVDGLKVVDRHAGGYLHESNGPARVTWSGSLIFTPDNVYDRDLSESPVHVDGYGFGALSPNYLLALKTTGRGRHAVQEPILKVYAAGANQLIATLKDLPEITSSALPPEQRIWYVPAANLLAIVGAGNNHIFLRRFSAIEALNESGIDYLLVTSNPNPVATRGGRYDYPIQTQSKRGGVKYSIVTGPPGMSIAADGKLKWNVPRDFKEGQVQVMVSIKDASGQAIFHTFKIHIQDPTPAGPRPPTGPRAPGGPSPNRA